MHVLQARTFKRLVRAGKSVPSDALLRKEFVSTVETISDRQRRFVISTNAVDREWDIISQSGWQLDAYRKNSVVLWDHGSNSHLGSMPVGRAVRVELHDGRLVAEAEFDPPDMPITGPWAEAILRKLDNGSLAATSVGFRPLDWSVPEGESARGDDWSPGIDFLKQELVEFSIVAIPCNAETLLEPMEPPGNEQLIPGTQPPVVEDGAVVAALKAAEEAAQSARGSAAEAKAAAEAVQRAADTINARAFRYRILETIALG